MDRRTFLKTLFATVSLAFFKFPESMDKFASKAEEKKYRGGEIPVLYGKSPRCATYFLAEEEAALGFIFENM